jgi:hypothetical protein
LDVTCYGLTNSKSKWYMISGRVNVVMYSASVLPRQIRLPPKKGQNENLFLILPSGLKCIGDFGLNRSGSKLSGLIHSFGSV